MVAQHIPFCPFRSDAWVLALGPFFYRKTIDSYAAFRYLSHESGPRNRKKGSVSSVKLPNKS
jgi:hypothetical protein